MEKPKIVSHEEWLDARKALLAKEKEFTRLRDDLSTERRDLPWERVTKDYVFDCPDGKVTLAQLFDGKSQLIVYHFMLAPDWDAGCKACSFWADNFNGIDIHLRHRDVTFLAISRAPLPKIDAYKKRMGWSFKWVSSFGSDFNYDFNVSYTPEDLVGGAASHNYTKHPSRRNTPVLASSLRTQAAPSTIPIPVTRAASTSSMALTVFWTWRLKAATRRACLTPSPGWSGTMSTMIDCATYASSPVAIIEPWQGVLRWNF
jgi:predicted dithiol-disulfide oxidoreductase (DUF899 family)